MNLEQRYKDRLAALHGRLPDGTPKLRVVTPAEALHPHGALKGLPKYSDPVSGNQMPFLILEQWRPPEFAGSKETWDYTLRGVHPSDCPSRDCCNGGVWGFFMPLTNQLGQYLPFTDTIMDAIERHIYESRQYAELTEIERQESLTAGLSLAQEKKDEVAIQESNAMIEHYLKHKQELDNADTRILVGFGKNTLPEVKGGKMPIGSPLEKI